MFANTGILGSDLAFPDVAQTPAPAGPVPLPFPNIATSASDIPSTLGAIIGGGLGGLDPRMFLNMMGGGEDDVVGASMTPAQSTVMMLG